ncbi:ArsR/SmtB family transcription factor [Pseudothermotoga sp. U03pept]|uniref:ArsR/SmtB family transcription factor n=1 Tax=Pseudothermotoga sp. U03pept TaxID=3447012 RepID=UPI003F00E154
MKVHELLRILSNPTRLQILSLLLEGELCVCQIYATVGTSQPNISQHLNILRQFKLVDVRKEGAFVYYSVKKRSLQEYPFLESILQNARKEYSKPLKACKIN